MISRAVSDALKLTGGHVRFALLVLAVTYAVGAATGAAVSAKTLTTLVLFPLAVLLIVVLVAVGAEVFLAPVRLARDQQAEADARINALMAENAELRVSAEPAISDAHRLELQEIAEGLEESLDPELAASYRPPGRAVSQPVALSFRTHFPDAARMLDDWDALVLRIEGSREAMREWVLAETAKRGVTYEGPLPIIVARQIEHHGMDKLTWSVAEGHLFITGFAMANVSPGDDVEALKKPLDGVLADAQKSTEALALQEDRERLDDSRERMRDHLQHIRAMHVIRGRCDLCA